MQVLFLSEERVKKELIILLFVCPLVFFYVFSRDVKRAKVEDVLEVTMQDSFDVLQGRDTDDWSYIHTKRDYQDLELYRTLYKKNYKYQFNANPIFKIPKTVHLIWIGPRPFPTESIENIRTWIAHHPDWTFNFWTDRPRMPPCETMHVRLLKNFKFQFLEDKYEASKNWGEKSDIWRYEILYAEGGVYIDHDASCLRPFHGLHTGYDFYAGLEMPHEEIDERALTAGIGIIGAKPEHPVILKTIQTVLERWDQVTATFSTSDPFIQARRVAYRSYIALTYALQDQLNLYENTDIVFPACYFYPKHGLPGFYSIHLYGTLWHSLHGSPNERFFQKMLSHIRDRDAKIIRVEVMSLFAMIGCLVVYLLVNREIKRQFKRSE